MSWTDPDVVQEDDEVQRACRGGLGEGVKLTKQSIRWTGRPGTSRRIREEGSPATLLLLPTTFSPAAL
jgi:hypothetical protein